MRFTRFEKFLIGANILVGLYFLVSDGITNWLSILGFFASVSNTLCVVLVAKKKISNFIWGAMGTFAYGIVSYNYANTGEWMLNLLYYFPANFVGWYFWNKSSDNKQDVKSKNLTKKQSIIVYTATVVLTLLYAYVISLHSVQMWLYKEVSAMPPYKYTIDSLSTVLSIVAMILMIKCYKEQWILWIIVNIASIILWIITFNPIMIVLWSTLLVNSVYGYMKWKKVGE